MSLINQSETSKYKDFDMQSVKHYILNTMHSNSLKASILLLGSISAHAAQIATSHPAHHEQELYQSSVFKKMIPKFSASYIDLDFNSSAENSYNLFHGFSNIYSAGIDNLRINRKTSAGLYLFQINSRITSRTYLFPTHPINAHTSISNNTLFGHVLRKINKKMVVDVLGSIGQNNMVNNSTIEDVSHITGYSNTTNQVYLVGASGSYLKPVKKLQLKFSLGGLFNLINSGTGYSYHNEGFPMQTIKPLVTKTGIVFENLELGYRMNRTLTPYISGGLVQVPYFSNSRRIFDPAQVVGPVPQLVMNQSAYRLGAGISINKKSYSLRIDQRYYNSVNTLITNTTTATLSCRFS